MKNLLLLRHGKSDWEASYDRDHDRPLARRGEVASCLVGRFLARTGPLPDLVITSSAVRAQATLELAKKAGGWPGSIRVSHALYEGDPTSILQIIQDQEDSIDTLMLVGHNPAWEILAGRMIGGGTLKLPTAALLRIKFPCGNWKRVDSSRGSLAWLVTPKILQSLELRA